MRAFRFVHVADVHLDSPFRGKTESLRKRLREHLRQAFRRVVDLSLDEEADALLIAGDLFDNDRLSFATETFLVEEMSRLQQAGIPVFYATGNHDPGRANCRAGQIRWPDNVHLFRRSNPEVVDVVRREGTVIARVTGAGHVTSAESQNLASRFPAVTGTVPHVALLHCWVTGASAVAGEHERYAPCATRDLAGKGYSYWALGHIHARQEVLDNSAAMYPGNLQGRHPRETGPKGALLVDVAPAGHVQARFMPLAPARWEQLELSGLENIGDLDNLRTLMRNQLHRVCEQDPEVDWLLRVNLKGACPLYSELLETENLEFLANEVAEETGLQSLEIRTESLFPPVKLADYREGPHLLATTLELLRKAQQDDNLLIAAAPGQLAGLDHGREQRISYLKSLLPGLEEMAASRLIKESEG